MPLEQATLLVAEHDDLICSSLTSIHHEKNQNLQFLSPCFHLTCEYPFVIAYVVEQANNSYACYLEIYGNDPFKFKKLWNHILDYFTVIWNQEATFSFELNKPLLE